MKKIAGFTISLALLPAISQAEPISDTFHALGKFSASQYEALVTIPDNQLATIEGATNVFTDLSSLWRSSGVASEGVNNRLVLNWIPNWAPPTQGKSDPSKPQASTKSSSPVGNNGINYTQITQSGSSSNANNSANISQN